MTIDNAVLPNFLIAGTEKAGTTSVFVYLSQHPQVCASLRKETDFFRDEFTGNPEVDRRLYMRHFRPSRSGQQVVMEASPGYLGEAEIVAPRIQALLPAAQFLFILRDPVERLYSAYNFYISRLTIPPDLSFSDFVEKSLAFERDGTSPQALGVGEWYLRTLSFGRYAERLAEYFARFPRANIKVMFFESLTRDEIGFMTELSGFLGIDQDFWQEFEFRKSNVTFAGRHRFLHRIALRVNDWAEPFLRQRPDLKHSLVGVYKSLNQAADMRTGVPDAVRQQLVDYYSDSVTKLGTLLGEPVPESWLQSGRQQRLRGSRP